MVGGPLCMALSVIRLFPAVLQQRTNYSTLQNYHMQNYKNQGTNKNLFMTKTCTRLGYAQYVLDIKISLWAGVLKGSSAFLNISPEDVPLEHLSGKHNKAGNKLGANSFYHVSDPILTDQAPSSPKWTSLQGL